MSGSSYTIRNYRSADFNEYVLLNIEAERLEPAARQVSPQIIAEHLSRPNYSPGQDLFLAEIYGHIIGYMDLKPELGIERVVLDCWVHPKHRRKGLSTKLVGCAMQRGKVLGAKVAHVNTLKENTIAKRVLPKLGFKFIRQFLRLGLNLAEAQWSDTNQVALEYRCLQQGEESKLAQIQNRAFARHWGYNPNTEEEITYSLNSSGSSLEDVIVACDGDKIVGFCWTRVVYKEGVAGEREGQVHMIGVGPDYRGKGIGKKLALTGLAHLNNKGIKAAGLFVDSENKIACALYKSIGFEVQASSLWYEKVID